MPLDLRGTHGDFFRTDNPFLLANWTFGDDGKPDPVTGLPDISGVLKDSSTRGRTWVPKAVLTGDSYSFVPGLASYGGSGVRFNTIPEVSGVDNRYSMLLTSTVQVSNQGNFSAADRNSMSGFTVAGWVKIPHFGADAAVRNLVGNYSQANPNNLGWAVLWNPVTDTISFRFSCIDVSVGVSNIANIVHVHASKFPTSPTGAVFFACTVEQQKPNFGGAAAGSGLASIYIGTANSGMTLAVQSGFNGVDIRMSIAGLPGGDFSDNNFALGADGHATHGATSTYNVPSGTVFDDFSVWHTKLSLAQLEYLKTYGVNRVDKTTPATAGTTNLVALWKFEDTTGTNSSSAGSAYNFAHFGDAVPIAGVNGNALRLNAATNNTGTTTTVGSILPRLSGVNAMFPGNVNDPGGSLTYIFWAKDIAENSMSVGWVNSSNSTNQGIRLFHDTTGDNLHALIGWRPSGILNASISNSNPEGAPYFAQKTGHWHLYALVWDYLNGTTYVVRDARFIIGSAIDMHPSGMNKTTAIAGGVTQAGMKLLEVNLAQVAWDEFAIYNRALTLNEMSGYAVAGTGQVETQPTADFTTANPRMLAYWKCNTISTYGPDSRLRIDDSSYYRHHLVTLSGNLEPASAFKSEGGSGSINIAESGSFFSIPRSQHGANLDFSQKEIWFSGFTVGTMLSVPNGTQTDRNYAIMGSWSQSLSERSWLLGAALPSNGIGATKLSAKVVVSGITYEASGQFNLPTNTSFFVGMSLVPSGVNGYSALSLFYSANDITSPVQVIGYTIVSGQNISPCSESGFSMMGVENMQMGWPVNTKIQGAFIFAGNLATSGLTNIKNSAAYITDVVLASGSVSTSDPYNVSHWTFDEDITRQLDKGQGQNHLFKVGAGQTLPAVHTNGVESNGTSWVQNTPTDDTVPVSGLDLGSGTLSSFTILGWIRPGVGNSQTRTVLNKGGTASGYQINIKGDNTYQFAANSIFTSGNNSQAIDSTFQHFAYVQDKVQGYSMIILNGRYAGISLAPLQNITPNLSGIILGGAGDQGGDPVIGGGNFSGLLDDWMIFNRALTLPEISGLAANSYNYRQSVGSVSSNLGAWISGQMPNIVSGLLGAFLHGHSNVSGFMGGYISGVNGSISQVGGWVHGSISMSGITGGFINALGNISGFLGAIITSYNNTSGIIGSWIVGGQSADHAFDASFTFTIVSAKDFDARVAAELTRNKEFDANIGVIRITTPPTCAIILPVTQSIYSGLPQTITVTGSGISLNNKELTKVRFTFADFKDAELGVLSGGIPNSGLYTAVRTFDTPGYYNIKMEVIDEFGYRSSDVRPILIIPSGSTSGQYLSRLPGIAIIAIPQTGATIQSVAFQVSFSGLSTTSGIIDYIDFADEQETLVNPTEVPIGNISVSGIRNHSYGMPGKYMPVWAMSGSWGIVSDTLHGGIDYL